MSILETVKGKLIAAKPFLQGLVVGLIVGPIIVLWIGWMVTSGTLQEKVDAALVNERASICAARARDEVKDTTKLKWEERKKLAVKWSTMPGQKPGSADDEVTNACADKLSEAP